MANKHTHRQYLASIILWMIFTAVSVGAMIYFNDGVFFAPTLMGFTAAYYSSLGAIRTAPAPRRFRDDTNSSFCLLMAIMGLLLALSSWFALIWVGGGFKTTLCWITLGLGAVVFITSWMLHRRYERRHGPFYSVGYRPKGKGSKFSPVNHGNRS